MASESVSRSGKAAEEAACDHLRKLGLRVLERNYRCRGGEIDIIAQDGQAIVFVEVKERKGSSHGSALEAVTAGKRRRIVRAARVYAAQRGLWGWPVRFDVVAIDWSPRGPRVRHERGAFDEEGR